MDLHPIPALPIGTRTAVGFYCTAHRCTFGPMTTRVYPPGGEVIRDAREGARITLRAGAALLGISPVVLSKLERGELVLPADERAAVLRAFGR
jgi:hypothetical protein